MGAREDEALIPGAEEYMIKVRRSGSSRDKPHRSSKESDGNSSTRRSPVLHAPRPRASCPHGHSGSSAGGGARMKTPCPFPALTKSSRRRACDRSSSWSIASSVVIIIQQLSRGRASLDTCTNMRHCWRETHGDLRAAQATQDPGQDRPHRGSAHGALPLATRVRSPSPTRRDSSGAAEPHGDCLPPG